MDTQPERESLQRFSRLWNQIDVNVLWSTGKDDIGVLGSMLLRRALDMLVASLGPEKTKQMVEYDLRDKLEQTAASTCPPDRCDLDKWRSRTDSDDISRNTGRCGYL